MASRTIATEKNVIFFDKTCTTESDKYDLICRSYKSRLHKRLSSIAFGERPRKRRVNVSDANNNAGILRPPKPVTELNANNNTDLLLPLNPVTEADVNALSEAEMESMFSDYFSEWKWAPQSRRVVVVNSYEAWNLQHTSGNDYNKNAPRLVDIDSGINVDAVFALPPAVRDQMFSGANVNAHYKGCEEDVMLASLGENLNLRPRAVVYADAYEELKDPADKATPADDSGRVKGRWFWHGATVLAITGLIAAGISACKWLVNVV